MDQLIIFERARGQFFKLLLASMVIVGAFWAMQNAPKTVSRKMIRKTVTIRLTYLPNVLQGLAGIAALYMIYIVALTKTTNIVAGRVNLTHTRGLFDRKKDALDMTGVQDFTQEQNIFDMILGVCTFTVYSRDHTDPNLVLRGITKKDAIALYEHLTVYSNRSIVKYVQSQNDRDLYRKKYHTDQDGKEIAPDRYVKTRIRDGGDEDQS